MIEITIVTHYEADDPECGRDYTEVDVYLDGALKKSFGDAYHDDGLVKAESWVEGYVAGRGCMHSLSRRDVADTHYSCCETCDNSLMDCECECDECQESIYDCECTCEGFGLFKLGCECD